MIINKITTGFVVQQYDTELKTYVFQEFVASDDVKYETEDGDELPDNEEILNPDGSEPYLPFEMVQPLG